MSHRISRIPYYLVTLLLHPITEVKIFSIHEKPLIKTLELINKTFRREKKCARA
jgi:hypothetical protein